MQLETHDLPEYWGSYLINEDSSGLEPEEKARADRALAYIGHGFPMGIGESEDVFFGDTSLPYSLFPDVLTGSMIAYTFDTRG